MLENYISLHDQYHKARTHIEKFGGYHARNLRRQSKQSLRKFAVAIDISPSYLSKIENGHLPLSAGLARKMLEVTKG